MPQTVIKKGVPQRQVSTNSRTVPVTGRQIAANREYANRQIQNARAMTKVTKTAGLVSNSNTSAFCGQTPVTDPEPCPLETGFPGSMVEAAGGSVVQDYRTCGQVSLPDHTHTLGQLSNVDASADCPNDGDVLMWKAGTGTKPGSWVPTPLTEVFDRACLERPNELSDEDCAALQSTFTSATKAVLPRSRAPNVSRSVQLPPVVEDSKKNGNESYKSRIYGNGVDGDLKLEDDSELAADMYFHNLDLNGFILYTKGFRLFVNGVLNAGRNSVYKLPGCIVCDGEDGTLSGPGNGAPRGSLGGGSNANEPCEYSIAGSTSSGPDGGAGSTAVPVPDSEGGVAVLHELESAVKMRALDGKRLEGGPGGIGPNAGGGGGVVFVAARTTNYGGLISAKGGKGAKGSGSGGGGAIVFIHEDSNKWQTDVSGGDAAATAGTVYHL